jgi:hypothetical protein
MGVKPNKQALYGKTKEECMPWATKARALREAGNSNKQIAVKLAKEGFTTKQGRVGSPGTISDLLAWTQLADGLCRSKRKYTKRTPQPVNDADRKLQLIRNILSSNLTCAQELIECILTAP